MTTARSPVTGRFVATANTSESSKGTFPTFTEMPVNIQGADPNNLAYDTVARYAPDADELAQGGDPFPPRPRTPMLVSASDIAATDYGSVQGALLRQVARDRHSPMDPSLALVDPYGHAGHHMGLGAASGVRDVADDMPGVQDVPSVLRPASRGLGRARER